MDNRIKIHFVNLPNKSDEAFLELNFGIGRLHEPEKLQGALHLIDHYLAGQFTEYQSDDFYTNSYISNEFLSFELKSKTKNMPKDIKVVAEKIFKPEFNDQEMLNYEKNAIKAEMISQTANTYNLILEKVLEQSLLINNKPRNSVYREIENIDQISLQELKEFYVKEVLSAPIFITIGGYKLSSKLKKEIEAILLKYKNNIGKDKGAKDVSVKFKAHKKVCVFTDPAIDSGVVVNIVFDAFGYERNYVQREVLCASLIAICDNPELGLHAKLRKLGIYGLYYNWRFRGVGGIVRLSFTATDLSAVISALELIFQAINKIAETGLNKKIIHKSAKDFKEYLSNRKSNNYKIFQDKLNDLLMEPEGFSETKANSLFARVMPEFTAGLLKNVFKRANMNVFIAAKKINAGAEAKLNRLLGQIN